MISKITGNEFLVVPDVGFCEVEKLVEGCGSSMPVALRKSVPCWRPFLVDTSSILHHSSDLDDFLVEPLDEVANRLIISL